MSSRRALEVVVSACVVLSMTTVFHAQTRKRGTSGTKPAKANAQTQQLVAEGDNVYQTVCIVCHQPGGEGKEKLGANLVTSPYVTGNPGLPIRIILNGKQGKVGLMPGQGTLLSDDQIAAVVTYIRKSWGHSASAVTPATVKDIRAQTSDRTMPWTDEDLDQVKGK